MTLPTLPLSKMPSEKAIENIFENGADNSQPKLNSNEGRLQMPMTTRTTVRWTDNEFEEVKRYADRRCISLSAAIREVLLKNIPEPKKQPRISWFA
jgi:hypothetical protein